VAHRELALAGVATALLLSAGPAGARHLPFPAISSGPTSFFPLAPCRVIDTRAPNGPLGGPALAAGEDRAFSVVDVCGIPSTATALSVNVAVAGGTVAGNVRLHPGGTGVPLVSSINYSGGQTRSNNAIVPLSATGELAAFVGAASGTVHLILDVNGYFALLWGPGESCSAPDQCASGSCVDGVCCDNECAGVCSACDLASSVGTCSYVPTGQDPDAECGGLSCVGYYYGWIGDTCYRKADVSAAQAMCGGDGACRTAAEECTVSPQGPAAVTCNATCQDPTPGTCAGTTAGSCTNVNPGNQTCGLGVCQVTVPQCVGGASNTCVPNWGAATTEVCDDLDNNCDGTVDNGAFADAYETNNTCPNYGTLPTVGSNQTLTQTALTLYPSGDYDYFRIDAVESDSSCSCCDFWCLDEDFRLTVTLTVPTGAGSYYFCTDTSCSGIWNNCQTVYAGTQGTWTWNLDGACPGNDSYSIYVGITPGGGPGFECRPYTLSYGFVPGCFDAGSALDAGAAQSRSPSVEVGGSAGASSPGEPEERPRGR
jgi:hypothetical protein